MRGRLRKIEKLINAVNLFNFALIFVFMVGASVTNLESMKWVSVVACSVLLISGFLNLIYWFIWQRFNK